MRTIIPENASLVPERAEKVFQGIIYSVYQWDEQMFDGTTEKFEMLKRPDTVEVLVINDDKILIQYQEQPYLGKFTSFPGGRHDQIEETELEAAKRELREETGYVCTEWKLIEVWQPHAKVEQFVYVYLAWNAEKVAEMTLDNGEKIENTWVTLEEFRNLEKETTFRSQAKKFLNGINHVQSLMDLSEFKGRHLDKRA